MLASALAYAPLSICCRLAASPPLGLGSRHAGPGQLRPPHAPHRRPHFLYSGRRVPCESIITSQHSLKEPMLENAECLRQIRNAQPVFYSISVCVVGARVMIRSASRRRLLELETSHRSPFSEGKARASERRRWLQAPTS